MTRTSWNFFCSMKIQANQPLVSSLCVISDRAFLFYQSKTALLEKAYQLAELHYISHLLRRICAGSKIVYYSIIQPAMPSFVTRIGHQLQQRRIERSSSFACLAIKKGHNHRPRFHSFIIDYPDNLVPALSHSLLCMGCKPVSGTVSSALAHTGNVLPEIVLFQKNSARMPALYRSAVLSLPTLVP
jgi:hypothetical protein